MLVVGVIAFFLLAYIRNSTDRNGLATNTQPTSTSQPTTSTLPRQTPVWGEYHVNAPNALMLVDAQGRRTGKDPTTRTLYREIAGTSYGEEYIGTNHGVGELFTSDLPNGHYTLYVLGGQTGSYWLDASHYGQQDQTFRGNIQAGSMIAYVQNYDMANLASSTFLFSSTTSSTASITSVLPNNLPPPPVPGQK